MLFFEPAQKAATLTQRQPVFAGQRRILPHTADQFTLRFAGKAPSPTAHTKKLVADYADPLFLLNKQLGLAEWDLYTGKGEAAEEATTEAMDKLRAFTNNANALKDATTAHKQIDQVRNRKLRRQSETLYRTFLEGGLNPELQKTIDDKTTALTALYNSFRINVNGQTLSNTDANERFKYSADPAEVKAMWEARQAIGDYKGDGDASVAERLMELVKLRNELARSGGYKNYFSMTLALNDIDEDQLLQLMHDVATTTDAPFKKLQDKVNAVTEKHFGINAGDVRLPWFQSLHALGSALESGNMMRLYNFDADAPFKGKDPVPLLEKTANAMGSTIQKIIDDSDLYYDPNRPDKAQHWFCFSPDGPTDVRALENIDRGLQKRMGYAFSTSLHEVLGHGLDYSQLDAKLPGLLREHHAITTESNAMLIEWLVNDERWFKEILGLPADEAKEIGAKAKESATAQTLVNLRAMMATIDFERSMYNVPDNELSIDRLNSLWGEKQLRYLGEQRPEGRTTPDWARVPHYMDAPYYHNYFIAELRRAQVLDYINQHYGHLLTKRAGAYLRKHRKDGDVYDWNEIIQRMTGKPLGVDALKKELSVLQ